MAPGIGLSPRPSGSAPSWRRRGTARAGGRVSGVPPPPPATTRSYRPPVRWGRWEVADAVPQPAEAGLLAWEEPVAQPERDRDEADQHGHFDERPDDRRERSAVRHPEGRDRDGDRELEVVRGGGEGERRGLPAGRPHLPAHEERHEEHQREVDEEGDREDRKSTRL